MDSTHTLYAGSSGTDQTHGPLSGSGHGRSEGKTFLDPVLRPLERVLYRFFGLDPKKEQDWKGYTFSLLLFSLVGLLFTYFILRLQHLLPLNPQGFGPVPADLAFNTAVSFTTNTNWQNYGGESTLSYFSQMVGLVFHNFASAAVGLAAAAALVRGIARHSAKTIGNFWVDLIRGNLYLLLPISLVLAVFLVSQGMIQNFKAYDSARLIEPLTIQVPKKDAGGQEIKDAQGNPVMEEQKLTNRPFPRGRWPPRWPSRCWGPTAAVFSMPMPPILMRTRPLYPIFFRCWPSFSSPAA